MTENKIRLCIFSHYFSKNYFPVYVVYFLEELSKYFDKIIIVTNNREIENSPFDGKPLYSVLFVKNEGYDLGMFYKAFEQLDIYQYSQIALINDSNVVFGSLQKLFVWGNQQETDVWGYIDSHQKPRNSTHLNNYHIQSHFIVFNPSSYHVLELFFKSININDYYNELDVSRLKWKVINDWEIGLTQFMLKNGMKCTAFINSKEYSRKYWDNKPVNVSSKLYRQTIEEGIPAIKKRVITSTNLKYIFTIKGNWRRLIRKHGDKSHEVEGIINELAVFKKEYFFHKLKSHFKFLKKNNKNV